MSVTDLDVLVQIQREGAIVALGHVFPQERYPFPVDVVRRRWEEEVADPGIDCFAVLGPYEAVAGFAATRANQFLHFGTAVETWGSGLAGRAHDAVLRHLVTHGHRGAWLRVFERNERARRFYERRGWRRTGQSSRSEFPPYPILLSYQVALTGPPASRT